MKTPPSSSMQLKNDSSIKEKDSHPGLRLHGHCITIIYKLYKISPHSHALENIKIWYLLACGVDAIKDTKPLLLIRNDTMDILCTSMCKDSSTTRSARLCPYLTRVPNVIWSITMMCIKLFQVVIECIHILLTHIPSLRNI
jgi:hypothetical protein